MPAERRFAKRILSCGNLLDKACFQMQRDYALKKLMDRENERLRQRLFNKENKVGKKPTTDYGRHLTSEENLQALALVEWKTAMKEVFASNAFKERRKLLDDEEKQLALEEKEREKQQRKDEQEEKKREKEREKERLQEEKRQEKEQIKRLKGRKRRDRQQNVKRRRRRREWRPDSQKNFPKEKQDPSTKKKAESSDDDEDYESVEDVIDDVPAETTVPQSEATAPPKPRPLPRPLHPRMTVKAATANALLQEMGPVRRSRRNQEKANEGCA
ncbi:hypothetical protein CPB84DRAFT_1829297 [Gymnopilus junonius]|uniref:Uncharacterized protein n=1 Tax=Gymnopilus junonius TaxID=109634 RepID=A0A9P5NBI1_GYMJU|nr:hypothetical protein CPB84DRAFT_1829297 [Gymnopilus junonius]